MDRNRNGGLMNESLRIQFDIVKDNRLYTLSFPYGVQSAELLEVLAELSAKGQEIANINEVKEASE